MSKPVHTRVAEKIATLFDDEERGYLWLTITQGAQQEKVASQAQSLFDPTLFAESLKLAQEDPEALRQVYEKTAAEVAPETLQAIEKQAEYDVTQLVSANQQFQKQAFIQGVYQYEGFKYAAAHDQAQQASTQTAQTLAEKAPNLARAAGVA